MRLWLNSRTVAETCSNPNPWGIGEHDGPMTALPVDFGSVVAGAPALDIISSQGSSSAAKDLSDPVGFGVSPAGSGTQPPNVAGAHWCPHRGYFEFWVDCFYSCCFAGSCWCCIPCVHSFIQNTAWHRYMTNYCILANMLYAGLALMMFNSLQVSLHAPTAQVGYAAVSPGPTNGWRFVILEILPAGFVQKFRGLCGRKHKKTKVSINHKYSLRWGHKNNSMTWGANPLREFQSSSLCRGHLEMKVVRGNDRVLAPKNATIFLFFHCTCDVAMRVCWWGFLHPAWTCSLANHCNLTGAFPRQTAFSCFYTVIPGSQTRGERWKTWKLIDVEIALQQIGVIIQEVKEQVLYLRFQNTTAKQNQQYIASQNEFVATEVGVIISGWIFSYFIQVASLLLPEVMGFPRFSLSKEWVVGSTSGICLGWHFFWPRYAARTLLLSGTVDGWFRCICGGKGSGRISEHDSNGQLFTCKVEWHDSATCGRSDVCLGQVKLREQVIAWL